MSDKTEFERKAAEIRELLRSTEFRDVARKKKQTLKLKKLSEVLEQGKQEPPELKRA